ncbi:MAG: xanthine dehydrogenase family protein molybdopterin-binding subunit [Acidisphaera sp.]|nr:xanthine dehydrogenase family protein molybdopterin-binding subunit [Acidisphaera sp.]
MNAPVDADDLALTKFGIGQPVPRKEDPVLLRGEGRYTDDINRPGQLYAVMVRSRVAHGRILGIDVAAARAMPGVLGVYTGEDLRRAGLKNMPKGVVQKNHDGTPMQTPPQPPLTTDKVRYVGDPVACVVAETVKQARDAAELVMPDIDPLPVITTASAAAAAGAPLVHDDVPGNLVLDFRYGDAAKTAEAFAKAAHVTRLELRNSRIVVSAMEPRSAIGEYHAADERWVLNVGSQGVFGMRGSLKSVLDAPVEKIRVLTGNVGGSFGMKASVYPEYIAILHAARTLGRPVKWTDERSESFLSDSHGRDHEMTAELALDAEGKFLAVRVIGYGNLGAYLSNATTIPPTINAQKNIVDVYATEAVEIATRCVFTNTTPVGPYRGAGRPEGNYYMERLIDAAAAELGIDRVALRRRNHIRPEQMPYKAPNGSLYDSGDFPTVLDKALALADWDGFPARQRESRDRGFLRGRGIGQYLEVTAPPQHEMGGIRFEPDGTVTIITGTLDYGQGHASPFAQVLVDRLGVPFERIRLLQGDSDELIAGGGTGGSKSIMASGAAIVEASEKVIEQGRRAAAHVLEAAVADIEFSRGRFRIAGTDRGIGIMELAEALRNAPRLPDDVPRTLDIKHIHESAPSAYPNGCHVAEVEVDAETGVVHVVKYTMVNDFGVVINPLLVEGQAHGGVVQGIGQALYEATAYDSDGQLLTGSYMDYALPHAYDLLPFRMGTHSVPARTNVLGAKGCGEAGCAGSLPSVMNALVDALGVRHIDMPATPPKVWAVMQEK